MYENYLHITGESLFTYDMDMQQPTLYGKVVCSTIAYGKIINIDTSLAKSLNGVRCVLTYKEIPGINDASDFEGDEPCLVENQVNFYGDAIALIAATSIEIAEKAAKLIKIIYQEETPLLTIDQAIAANSYLYPKPMELERGNAEAELSKADHYIEGIVESPVQEHWYLETNCTFASPKEEGDIVIYSSTQNPSGIQSCVAKVLGILSNKVSVVVKRIGGGFGGKETWSAKVATWAALLANASHENVYLRLNREEDQSITAKRHAFKTWYKVAFNKDGKLHSVVVNSYTNGGYARDLTSAIMLRAMFHAENVYYSPNIKFTGHCCKTNLLNFGAFRGFGGPQGILVIEEIMEKISEITGIDPWDIRKRNFFSINPKDESHYSYYGQGTLENRLFDIEKSLRISSDYDNRCAEVEKFNATHKVLKRGIGISPLKFGIAFNHLTLNQAGALINIYRDGSVQINHGGVEMGQGITAKMRKIVVDTLGLSPKVVRVMVTDTDKIPNTSPTAASTGSDLNGMAVLKATTLLRNRLAEKASELLNCNLSDIEFANDKVWCKGSPERSVELKEIVKSAYESRLGLSFVGHYKTPKIHWDMNTYKGEPFSYYTYGMAVSEVEINKLTGDMQIIRTDILHDVGKSLNREIDIGQIEGAFLQGVGWLTMEHMEWDNRGKPLNTSPDTYKIPTIQDIPLDLRVSLLEDKENPYGVFNSKAVGEPPLIYGISVYLAQQKALKSK